jgi:hypothetical protein
MVNGAVLTIFATFALASQAILLAFFASRRWFPAVAGRFGLVAYAFGILGVVAGAWLVKSGAPWQVYAGPFIYAVWAAFGAWADLFRRVEWRRPIRWSVFGPYLTLYLAAQMFLWWPLWTYWRPGWFVYLVLFIANTGLNLQGHFGPEENSTARPRPA